MVRQSEVQKLEDEARELATIVSEQSLDLKEQKRELEQLRCRTPRPSWPQLHERMHAAGAMSPAEPAEEHVQQQSSCQLAEALSNRVIEHARNLQVRSMSQPADHHTTSLMLSRCKNPLVLCSHVACCCSPGIPACRSPQQPHNTCAACLLPNLRLQQLLQLDACTSTHHAALLTLLCSIHTALTPSCLECSGHLIRCAHSILMIPFPSGMFFVSSPSSLGMQWAGSCSLVLIGSVLQVTIRIFSKQDTLQSILHLLIHVPGSSPSLHDAIYNLWLATDIPLVAIPHVGYSFIASLQLHGSSDALIGLYHAIWLGKAPMHALVRMGELLRGLSRILGTLSRIKLEDSPYAGLLPKADFVQMLRKLCPDKSEESIDRLAASLSWHEEGAFVRVGDIQCCGVDCTQMVDTATLCSSSLLNSVSEPRHVELEGAEERAVTIEEELPTRQPSGSLDADSQTIAQRLEQQEQLDDCQSATADAVDGDESIPAATTNSEQDSQEPASDVPSDIQATENTEDSERSNHTLPVLLLQQHAEELEQVRRATWEAVCACDQNHWPEGKV